MGRLVLNIELATFATQGIGEVNVSAVPSRVNTARFGKTVNIDEIFFLSSSSRIGLDAGFLSGRTSSFIAVRPLAGTEVSLHCQQVLKEPFKLHPVFSIRRSKSAVDC